MCVYSLIADHYIDKWNRWIPTPTSPQPLQPIYIPLPAPTISPLTQEEVDDFRKLLERAKKYDEENGEKDCELDSKKQKLKDLAKMLGVEIDFV